MLTSTSSYDIINMVIRMGRIDKINYDKIIKLSLRGYLDIVLENNKYEILIEFGYDYYMYVDCKLTESHLKEIVEKVTLTCATDDSRPILKGCLFEVKSRPPNTPNTWLKRYRLSHQAHLLD
mgnify:CR=1 FL=1